MSLPGGDRGNDVVLVIEHDPAVAELARRYLGRAGLAVHVAGSFAEAVAAIAAVPPAVVVLDLTMPGLTPGAVRRKLPLRGPPRGPQLICLEGPGGLRPRHVGITGDSGERCLRRPFSPRLLTVRVQDALRRHGGQPAAAARREPVLTGYGGIETRLTATESGILAFLTGHAGRVFTRGQVLDAVWGKDSVASIRAVDVHVAALRAKLGAQCPIRTVRGVGYAADNPPRGGTPPATPPADNPPA